MADENKIQLDVELTESSIEGSFKAIDSRAEKSAKASAAVFGEYFQKQEQDLKDSIGRLVGETRKVAEKSAKESAAVFAEAFKRQDEVYKASVKQNIDNAIKALTGGDGLKKSAQESASVFEEAFAKSIKKVDPITVPVEVPSSPLAVKGLADLAGGFYLLKTAALAAKEAVAATVDQIVQGEEKIKLEKRFEVLATQAGIAADVLKNDMNQAVRGLVDDDRLLQIASESFVQLGNNAKQLPQILDLARKTYKVFGGEVTSNTEAIIRAVETGNKRAITQIGLYVDLEKAVKNFARQAGTVPELLSQSQVQQARLNAVLAEGGERFKNISAEAIGAKDAMTKASVSFKELGDELSKIAAKNFGGVLSSISNAVSESVNSVTEGLRRTRPAETVDEIVVKMTTLRTKVSEYQSQLEQLGTATNTAFGANLRAGLITAEQQLEQYADRLDKMQMEQASALARGGGETPQDDGRASAEFLRRKQDLVNKVQELNAQAAASDVALAQQELATLQSNETAKTSVSQAAAAQRNALDVLQYQLKLQAAQQYEQQKAQLEKFFADNGVNDADLKNQAREALESQHVNNLLKIEQKYQEDRKKIQKASNDVAYNATQSALGQIATLQQNATGELAEIGKAAAITKATIDGYVAVQSALAQVPYPFNFAAAALVGVAAAANVAKIASVGGGGGSSAFSPATGGGSAGIGVGDLSPIVEAPKPEDTEPQTPKTEINLTIQGNVLDRRETGLAIAEILEEQFADQGLSVRGAV